MNFSVVNINATIDIRKILLDNTDKLVSWFFWVSMTVTGVMGFAIGLVTVMQVVHNVFIMSVHSYALHTVGLKNNVKNTYICTYMHPDGRIFIKVYIHKYGSCLTCIF